jgi:hypothetical protein
MLNTVLGLPKKGVSTLPQTYPSSSSSSREKSTPFTQTQMTTNPVTPNKTGRDTGKRLFESGTYKDPRLIYDVNIIFDSYLTDLYIRVLGSTKK